MEVKVERASQGPGGLVVTVSCLDAWAQVGGERGTWAKGVEDYSVGIFLSLLWFSSCLLQSPEVPRDPLRE